jgi:hypothetical protein
MNKILYPSSLANSLTFFSGLLALILLVGIFIWWSSPIRSVNPLIIVWALAFVILVSTIVLFLYWGKFQKLTPIFRNGIETVGNVVDVYFSRGSGYITCEYEYQQKKYRFTDSIIQNRKTKGIIVGQQVVLYVDQEKPSQAFIRNLYLNAF